MRRLTIMIVMAAVLAAGCGSSMGDRSTGGGGTSAGATGIAGLVQSFHASDRSSLSPLPDAKVGVYTRAFPVVGPPQADEPSPIATSATNGAGKFEIDGLKPGRYFVVAATAARWVEVTDGRVSTAKFAVCGDCAVPL
jgi:hypothetical protein